MTSPGTPKTTSLSSYALNANQVANPELAGHFVRAAGISVTSFAYPATPHRRDATATEESPWESPRPYSLILCAPGRMSPAGPGLLVEA